MSKIFIRLSAAACAALLAAANFVVLTQTGPEGFNVQGLTAAVAIHSSVADAPSAQV